MTVPMKQLGICSTCNHLKECRMRKDGQGPVTFCEEFDDYLPPKEVPVAAVVKVVGEERNSKNDTNKYKGLCVNCELRETCTFPKPDGGVWHCEEYE